MGISVELYWFCCLLHVRVRVKRGRDLALALGTLGKQADPGIM